MEAMYSRDNFISTSALKKLDGDFAALGFLFVLREILGGKSEGVIDLKALSSSLRVTLAKIYELTGILEDSFVISTRAEKDGRHIKLLTVPAAQEAGHVSQECSDFITDYLRRHGVIPGKSQNEQESPAAVSTALFMGNNFQTIKAFYSAVKSTLNDRREFTYFLNDNDTSSAGAARITSFANGLKNAGFLSSCSYKKSPQRTITAQVANTSEAHRFISGTWLETWTYCRAVQALTGGYACVRNLNVMLPGGENSEFDLLICRDGNLFWVESKTARYSAYLPKYSRIAQILELPPSRAFLVSPDVPSAEIQQGITCCNLETFPAALSESLMACT